MLKFTSMAIAHAGVNGLYEVHIHTKMNVDQASKFRQGLRPVTTAHVKTDDLRISSGATGSTDGDTIKHPKGFVFSMISPTKVGLYGSRLGHLGTTLF
jgi:hypothetical protein